VEKTGDDLALSSESDDILEGKIFTQNVVRCFYKSIDLTELNTSDILLGQFEKVSHTKSKWKCSLKDGIFTANGRDVAFSRAVGEFVWS